MPSIPAADLEIDFEDAGPRDAPVVLLLHGWPDDRASWSEVAAVLDGPMTLPGRAEGEYRQASTKELH